MGQVGNPQPSPTSLPLGPAGARIAGARGQQAQDLGSSTRESIIPAMALPRSLELAYLVTDIDCRVMVEQDRTWMRAQLGSDAIGELDSLLCSLWLPDRTCTPKLQGRKLVYRWAVTCQGLQ